jgi:hypothetical protein
MENKDKNSEKAENSEYNTFTLTTKVSDLDESSIIIGKPVKEFLSTYGISEDDNVDITFICDK